MISIYSLPVLTVMDGLKEAFIEFAEATYNGVLESFIRYASFKDILNKSYGIMPQYVQENGKWMLKSGAVSPLLHVGQSYGAALALIFLLVAMADIYMQEKMSIETFAKPFLQYLATVILMINCEKLVAFFWNFGVLFQKSMAKLDTMEAIQEVQFSFSKNTVSIGMAIGLIVGATAMLLVCVFCGAIIRICAYIANFSRMIEAAVRAVGFPIAMGISVDSNLRQGAVRYLKKFFAVALQGGIFVAVSFIYTLSCVTVLNSNAEGTADYFSSETAAGWDETSGYYWNNSDGTSDSDKAAHTSIVIEAGINVGEGVTSLFFDVLGSLIPTIGLALASIVVLFKSGQICNDIVGV